MRRYLFGFLLLLSAEAYPQAWEANRPTAGSAHPLPTQLFPADNWWNLNVSAWSVDANSDTLLSNYTTRNLSYDWGNNYGLPFCTVSADHSTITFAGATYSSESDMAVPFPMPTAARTEIGWSEQLDRTIESNTFGGDRHLMCVDTENNKLYEVYQPFYNATASPVTFGADGVHTVQPGTYYAAQVSTWDMNTNDIRTEGWTSTDAAGLQVLPGLVRYDDLYGSGPITHAHRMTFNLTKTGQHVWPATHHTSSGGFLKLGSRLRLKPGKTFTTGAGHCNDGSVEWTAVSKLLQAFKDYGLIVADNGTTGQVTGTNDSRWGDFDSLIRKEVARCLNEINIYTDLELLTEGYSPPLAFSTTILPDGTKNVAYNQIVRGTGGYNNYSFVVSAGSLPTGLTLTSGGTWATITGTPTGTGTSNFTVHVTDAQSQTADQALTISIGLPNGSGVTLDALQISPAENRATFKLGAAGLEYIANCNIQIKTLGDVLIDTVTSATGPSRRSLVSSAAGLSPGTAYKALQSCTGAQTTLTEYSFTTLPTAASGTRTVAISVKPSSRLTGVARVTLDYGTTSSVADGSTQNTSCASGCTVNLSLNKGVQYYRVRWQDASNNVLATSQAQSITVQ